MWTTKTLKRIIVAHAIRFYCKVRYGFEYHPIGGGQEEVTLETQATKITELEGQVTTLTEAATKAGEGFNWKGQIGADVANSPLMQKFPDTKEGLAEAVKSHASLEQLLGHEKVPIPKGPDDVEGHARFAKAMGVPDKAEGYGLPDAEIPESMKGMAFDKQKFAEIVHAFKLTPDQAKGLWGAYTDMNKEVYATATKEYDTKMTGIINEMRSEWGDAYDSNVELGQMVINKFSSDKETEEWLTANIMKDPRGIRVFAKIGAQFSENKVGEFGYKRFSLTPEQAQQEIDSINKDPKHAYNDEKATDAEHSRAVDHMNSLYVIINKAKG